MESSVSMIANGSGKCHPKSPAQFPLGE